jgi:hypothetical protein
MQIATVVYGLVIIVGMLAMVGLCFYMTWWLVMVVLSFIPIVGKRHRHDRWNEFQTARFRPSCSNHTPVGGREKPN